MVIRCAGMDSEKSIRYGTCASTFGGLVSAFCLLFFAPQISKVAMKFSSPGGIFADLQIFWYFLFIASVSGKSLVKGLISGGLGIFIGNSWY